MKNKKIGLIWKVVLVAGIFAAAALLYFSVAGGSGGFANGIVKDSSAIAVSSWDDVFNTLASSSSLQQQTVSDSSNNNNDDDDEGENSSSSFLLSSRLSPLPPTAQTFSSGGSSDISSSGDVGSNGNSDGNSGQVVQDGADADENEGSSISPPSVIKTDTAKNPAQLCAFMDPSAAADGQAAGASHGILLNEIAWMGSLPQNGETGAKASEREWIELKNSSAETVDASGWQILDSLGNLKIILAAGTAIPAGGFYLLVRGGDSLLDVQTDGSYAGALPNTGDDIELMDSSCGVSDSLDASAGWPAGNNTTKQTMERDGDGVGWHSSISPGGTPRAENSIPAAATAAIVASTSIPTTSSMPTINTGVSSTPQATAAPTTTSQYLVSVSIIGAGIGTVSSSPVGILCGFACQTTYAAGTKINFAASPAAGSLFKGWSGACAGSGLCSFTVSSSVAVVAEFDVVEAPPLSSTSSASTTPSSSSISTSTSSGQNAVNHLVIAAIQIAGASSSNDFIKIFNPTAAAINISGWKLHKKSSTGTDYSLRTFPSGSTIAPGGYFVWANSLDGFSESIAADASSTETLSPDNSAALLDANGDTIDQVAWGIGMDQYVEGSAYPTDPLANQVLARIFSNGAIVDTDNNASDFGVE